MIAAAMEPTTPVKAEDEPRTLIFVDMLGFGAWTLRHPTRTFESGPNEHGFLQSGTTPLQSRVVRFQVVLDQMFSQQSRWGVSGQVFSDCAYVDVKTSVRAARAAEDLMLDFIRNHVPVRMGIGRGTYYSFRHSIENVDSQTVTKALFAGTAVVNAHAAEQCGAKGFRILVHPSAVEDLRREGSTTLMGMPELKGVASELCYLPHDRHADQRIMGKLRLVDQDVELVRHVRQIEADSQPMDDEARRHYVETLAAIDRMRTALHRGNSLEAAERHVDEFNNEVDAVGDQGD
jgi:hypothetical protein